MCIILYIHTVVYGSCEDVRWDDLDFDVQEYVCVCVGVGVCVCERPCPTELVPDGAGAGDAVTNI